MADEVGTLEDVIEDLLEDLMGIPEDEPAEIGRANSSSPSGARSSQLTAKRGARADGLNVPEEADGGAAASAAEVESLRNYLDVFGKGA